MQIRMAALSDIDALIKLRCGYLAAESRVPMTPDGAALREKLERYFK